MREVSGPTIGGTYIKPTKKKKKKKKKKKNMVKLGISQKQKYVIQTGVLATLQLAEQDVNSFVSYLFFFKFVVTGISICLVFFCSWF